MKSFFFVFSRRTIAGRLIVFSVAFATASLVITSVILWLIVAGVVREQVDQRLDVQIEGLRSALIKSPGGAVGLAESFDSPPFDRIGSGWYWQISSSSVHFTSRSLGGATIDTPPMPFDWRWLVTGVRRDRDGQSAIGQPLHLRTARVIVGGEAIEILATSPRSALSAPAFRALLWLVPAMLGLGALLIAGILFQVRYGLRPLLELRTQIGSIASGRLRELPRSTVEELQPVTVQINRLVEQNRKRLGETRLHFANLAHSLKTPVASLLLALDDGNDRGGEMRGLVARIESRIRHHLGRARGMLSDPTIGLTTDLRPRIDDIINMMSRLYAGRLLEASCDVDIGLIIACAPEDTEEIFGAVIDNAFKWAKTQVHVESVLEGDMVVISVDDDGPGIENHRLEEALRAGVRLDESVPGDGFGLSIARELAEMHGGSLSLGQARPGGLSVSIRLPLASD